MRQTTNKKFTSAIFPPNVQPDYEADQKRREAILKAWKEQKEKRKKRGCGCL